MLPLPGTCLKIWGFPAYNAFYISSFRCIFPLHIVLCVAPKVYKFNTSLAGCFPFVGGREICRKSLLLCVFLFWCLTAPWACTPSAVMEDGWKDLGDVTAPFVVHFSSGSACWSSALVFLSHALECFGCIRERTLAASPSLTLLFTSLYFGKYNFFRAYLSRTKFESIEINYVSWTYFNF